MELQLDEINRSSPNSIIETKAAEILVNLFVIYSDIKPMKLFQTIFFSIESYSYIVYIERFKFWEDDVVFHTSPNKIFLFSTFGYSQSHLIEIFRTYILEYFQGIRTLKWSNGNLQVMAKCCFQLLAKMHRMLSAIPKDVHF